MTESQVPDAIAFGIFQDMRGIQETYRMTPATTTTLAQDLSATADIVYVNDTSALSEPDLSKGIFGDITINGERILYRVRDVVNNTLSSLQRGVYGTGAAEHSSGATVYDTGLGNQMAQQFQNYVVSQTTMGDDTTVSFHATNISALENQPVGFFAKSLEVYVGGHRSSPGAYATDLVPGNTYVIASLGTTDWYAVGLPSDQFPAPGVVFTATDVGTGNGIVGDFLAENYYVVTYDSPAEIEFLTNGDLVPPQTGVEVTILQRRGVNWYEPGGGNPGNGLALQETNTDAARFLRGL